MKSKTPVYTRLKGAKGYVQKWMQANLKRMPVKPLRASEIGKK